MTDISVIIPLYNGQRYVATALESIRDQQLEGIEIIVVDDGSTDRSGDIVREFARQLPIRLITPGRLGNWVAATNLGLREATGEWACFLHQDDFWLPHRISTVREQIGAAKGPLIVHNACFVGPTGERLGPWTCPLPQGDIEPRDFMEHLLVQNFIAIGAPLFRREVVIQTGSMDEALWFSADWDLWLRLGGMGPVRFMDRELYAFRVHEQSQTESREITPQEWKYQLQTVLDRHLPRWTEPKEARRREVERVGTASIEMNTMLANVSRGTSRGPQLAGVVSAQFGRAFLRLLTLGPAGWSRYVRDSRIKQRVGPRLRLRRRGRG